MVSVEELTDGVGSDDGEVLNVELGSVYEGTSTEDFKSETRSDPSLETWRKLADKDAQVLSGTMDDL